MKTQKRRQAILDGFFGKGKIKYAKKTSARASAALGFKRQAEYKV